MNRIMDFLVPFRTVILADYNTGAGRKTHKETDQHINDRSNSTDRRERLVADIIANHPGIHRVIKLLEHISDQKRQRETDYMSRNIAFRHIHVFASTKR